MSTTRLTSASVATAALAFHSAGTLCAQIATDPAKTSSAFYHSTHPDYDWISCAVGAGMTLEDRIKAQAATGGYQITSLVQNGHFSMDPLEAQRLRYLQQFHDQWSTAKHYADTSKPKEAEQMMVLYAQVLSQDRATPELDKLAEQVVFAYETPAYTAFMKGCAEALN